MLRVLSGFAVGIGLIFAFAFTTLNAQEDVDSITLSISPQLLDLTANPGDSIENTFRLTNGSENPISIKTTPKNFSPLGEEGAIDLTEDRTSYSISEWITTVPSTAELAPKESKDFVVTINVPENGEPGSHFGSVVFQTVPPEQEGAAALVSQEIAPVILVKVAGDVQESAEIEEFKSTKSFWSNENTIDFISRIENTGTVHFKPSGQIKIKNMFGNEVAVLQLDERNVLPNSIRQFTSEWQQGGFNIGRFSAELTIVYDNGSEIRTASTSFTVFPYQTIIPIVIILIIIVAIIIIFRKRIMLALKVLSGKEASK